MLPEVVTKTNSSGSARTGLNVEDTSIAGLIPSPVLQREKWTSQKTVMAGKSEQHRGNIFFTRTSNNGITATLGSPGDTFSIRGSEMHFQFWSAVLV